MAVTHPLWKIRMTHSPPPWHPEGLIKRKEIGHVLEDMWPKVSLSPWAGLSAHLVQSGSMHDEAGCEEVWGDSLVLPKRTSAYGNPTSGLSSSQWSERRLAMKVTKSTITCDAQVFCHRDTGLLSFRQYRGSRRLWEIEWTHLWCLEFQFGWVSYLHSPAISFHGIF